MLRLCTMQPGASLLGKYGSSSGGGPRERGRGLRVRGRGESVISTGVFIYFFLLIFALVLLGGWVRWPGCKVWMDTGVMVVMVVYLFIY